MDSFFDKLNVETRADGDSSATQSPKASRASNGHFSTLSTPANTSMSFLSKRLKYNIAAPPPPRNKKKFTQRKFESERRIGRPSRTELRSHPWNESETVTIFNF